MFSFRTSKIFYLVPAAILALSDAVPANTCTDAWFDIFNSTYFTAVREVYIDSVFFKDDRDEVTTKYLYENGKPVEFHQISRRNNKTLYSYNYIYYDVDESALKNTGNEHNYSPCNQHDTTCVLLKGNEYIYSTCSTPDTTCFQINQYKEGVLWGVQTNKATSNHIQVQTDDLMSEALVFQDSIIENIYIYYDTDSAKTTHLSIIADPDDDFKCNQKNDAGETETVIFYKPNESGFSLSYQIEDEFHEYFINGNKSTTSIRKNHKPVKISPKARYFDLLGRYKFIR